MKKSLMSLLFPLIFLLGCSTSKNLPYDDIYTKKGDFIPEVQKKERKEKREREVTFSSQVHFFPSYSYFHFNRDSDWDGIEDWADPWPFTYGPYVDMDGNGFVSYLDMQIAGFNFFWNSHHYNYFHHHNFWHHNYPPHLGYNPFFYPKPENNNYSGPRINRSGSGNLPSSNSNKPSRPQRYVKPEESGERKINARTYTPPQRGRTSPSEYVSPRNQFNNRTIYDPKKMRQTPVERNPSIKVPIFSPNSSRGTRSYSPPTRTKSSSPKVKTIPRKR